MSRRSIVWMILSMFACRGPATAVGVTLEDGQMVVGQVTTDRLKLQGAYGEVSVPLADVGMVLPVEGTSIAESHAHVTVWLRNGSELRGKWSEPELGMSFEAGGKLHPIELPTERMQALQLRASESWPTQDNYRVVTTHGDDFLVDAEKTTITVTSSLGTFGVTLAECLHVGPIGETTGDWRFALQSGTVLIGKPAESSLSFALPMGPDTLELPLSALVSLSRNSWYEGDFIQPTPQASSPLSVSAPEAMEPEQAQRAFGDNPDAGEGASAYRPPKARARAGLSSADGWFQNDRLEAAKR